MSLDKMLELEKEANGLLKQMADNAGKSEGTPVAQAPDEKAVDASTLDNKADIKKEPATGEQDKTGAGMVSDRELELWKQRYLTLQSKYDAEVPRYATEKRELKEENRELSLKIEALQSKFNSLEEGLKTRQQAELDDSVMENLKEELGDKSVSNLKNLVVSLIKEELNKYDKSIQDKVKTVESKLESGAQRQVLSEKQQYIRDLKLAMPDIYQKNDNPDWKLWLQTPAPYARGKVWQNLLDEAHASYDVDGVVEIFNACPAFKNGNGKAKEEPHAEPPKSRPGKSPTEEEKKYYSKKEYDKFYQDAARGKYADDQKAYQKLDEEFTKAMLEGRVR